MSSASLRRVGTPLWVTVFAGLALACASWAAPARAELSGAVDGRALFEIRGRYGGALMADLWMTRGAVRPGAAFGIAALSADAGASSRVLTPLAFSLAFAPREERSGLAGVARLGAYLGAEKGGFTGGGFGSAAVAYAIALGEGASVRLAVELWGLLGKGGGVFVGPSLGLGF